MAALCCYHWFVAERKQRDRTLHLLGNMSSRCCSCVMHVCVTYWKVQWQTRHILQNSTPLCVTLLRGCSLNVAESIKTKRKQQACSVWCLFFFFRKREEVVTGFLIASIFVQASWPCVKAVGRPKSCLCWRHKMRHVQTLLWSHTNTNQSTTSGSEVIGSVCHLCRKRGLKGIPWGIVL